MKKKCSLFYCFVLFLLQKLLGIDDTLQSACFTDMQFYSVHLKKNWHYSIYLPPSYDANPDKEYPVVYLLHGLHDRHVTFKENNFDGLFGSMMHNGSMEEAIFVCPDGFKYSWWLNSAVYGDIEDALVHDLIPMIEQKYRVRKTKGQRVIAGISMGGYGALRLALLYSELFQSCIMLSPAVFYPAPGKEKTYPGSCIPNRFYKLVVINMHKRGVFGRPFDETYYAMQNYRSLFPAYLQKKSPVHFYVFYGDKDPVTDNATKNLIDFFHTQQYPLKETKLSGEHDWGTWKQAFQQVGSEKIFAN